MALQIPRRLFSVDEFERMIDAGVFPPDERSELVRGEVVQMAPIGLRHAACVTRIQTLLTGAFGRSAIVWVQNPIRLAGNSLPQPDLALLLPREDYYEQSRPTPQDVLLVVEVSDSTLEYDMRVKLPLYAEAGIIEVWIVNLQDNVIDVYTQPMLGAYASIQHMQEGQYIQLSARHAVSLQVETIIH
jgi:Uma2 family endonuclease